MLDIKYEQGTKQIDDYIDLQLGATFCFVGDKSPSVYLRMRGGIVNLWGIYYVSDSDVEAPGPVYLVDAQLIVKGAAYKSTTDNEDRRG